MEPKIHGRVQKCLPLVSILNHMNPVHTHTFLNAVVPYTFVQCSESRFRFQCLKSYKMLGYLMEFLWLFNILIVVWNGSSGLIGRPVLNKHLTIYEVINRTSCVETLSCVLVSAAKPFLRFS
jgi:hypothetical protein